MNSIKDVSEYNFEGFRLTYEHFMDVNGKRIPLEQPLYVHCYLDRTYSMKPYVLNELLERMKDELYKRLAEDKV